MWIFVLRHTETAAPPGLCYGRSDVGLAQSYPEDRTAVLRRFYELRRRFVQRQGPVTQIVSSPLQRCARLAKDLQRELAAASNATPAENNAPALQWEPRLQELDFGDWESQAWDAIPPKALEAWGADFVREACPGGESYQDLYTRVTEWEADFRRAAQDDAGQGAPLNAADAAREASAVLVTHGGVVRALLARWGGVALEDTFRYAFNPGRIACFRRDESTDQMQVLAWND